MTVMLFQEWDSEKLKWNTILTEKYPTFSKALEAADKKWDEVLPLQRQGKHFHCRIKDA